MEEEGNDEADDDYLDEDTEEEDSSEQTKKASSSAKRTKDRDNEDTGKKSLSQADRFNAIASGSSSDADKVPKGKYEAIIREVVKQLPDSKGQSIRFKFELCDEDFEKQNQITQWFKIFDANEEPFEVGIRMLSQSLAKLGYELSLDEMDDIFDEINKETPGVIIRVSYSEGRDGRIFQNAIIDSTSNNDVIQAYRDRVVY